MHKLLKHLARRSVVAARCAILCAAGALSLTCEIGTSHAALVVADFNTLSPGAINTKEGGFGLSGPWVSSGAQSVVAGNLTSALYNVTQTGTAQSLQNTSMIGGPTELIAQRPLVSPLTGDVWFSFLAKLTDRGDRVGLSFNPTTGNPADHDGDVIFVGTGASDASLVGQLRFRTETPSTTANIATNLSQNGSTTYLVLGRIGINEAGANDTVSIWLNPNLTGVTNPSALPAASYTNNTNNWITNSQISRIGVSSYDSSSGDGGIFDSLRLSDTATAFLDVTRTPVTLPTTTPILRADFGAVGQLPQNAFNTLSGSGVTSLSGTMQSTSGAAVTVQLSVPSGTLQGRIRNNLTTGHSQANLLDDFIFNSGASIATAPPMTLTLTGLSAGTYTFIGYFNDSFFSGSDNALADNVVQIIDPLTNAVLATVTVSDLRNGHLTSTDGVARFTFITDGLAPVSFRFQGITSGDARFAFNGFELYMVPEPSTLLLGLFGAALVGGAAVKRRRPYSRGASLSQA